MIYNKLLIFLSDNIGSIVTAGLSISVSIALIIGFITYKLTKVKLRYKIILALFVGLLAFLISAYVFFKTIGSS